MRADMEFYPVVIVFKSLFISKWRIQCNQVQWLLLKCCKVMTVLHWTFNPGIDQYVETIETVQHTC